MNMELKICRLGPQRSRFVSTEKLREDCWTCNKLVLKVSRVCSGLLHNVHPAQDVPCLATDRARQKTTNGRCCRHEGFGTKSASISADAGGQVGRRYMVKEKLFSSMDLLPEFELLPRGFLFRTCAVAPFHVLTSTSMAKE